MHSTFTRASVTAAAGAGLVLAACGSAAAHVAVEAPGAAQGAYSVAIFRVPTESETANTTSVTITMPAGLGVRTEPVPGWTAKLDKNPAGQVTAVTWAADPGNAGIAPGQFQRFAVGVGPLPKQETVSFPIVQNYSDGSLVRWDQPANSDGSEPERPAPALKLDEAEEGGLGHGGHDSGTDESAGAPGDQRDDTDRTARWLGGIGLALGLFAVALGLGNVLRGRRS